MSWGMVAVAAATVGAAYIASEGRGGGGGGTSSGAQTTEIVPGPRTEEGKKFLETLMSEYFGDDEAVGLKGLLGEQEEFLGEEADKFISDYETLTDTYTGKLKDIETGGLLDPYTVTFGGESPVSFVPKRSMETAGLLGDLARNIYGAETDVAGKKMQMAEKFTPGWSQLAYLEDLWKKAHPLEAMRYSIPTTTQTGSLDQPGPHWTTQAGNLMSLAQSGLDLYSAFKKPTPTPSADPNLYGHGVGPNM